MDENQVQETGMERFRRLQAEAKALGITGKHNTAEYVTLIAQKKAELENPAPVIETPEAPAANIDVAPPTEVPYELSDDQAAKIDAEMKHRFEAEEKFRETRRLITERAGIIAESELLGIAVDLPENATELQIARARVKLGIEKTQEKPSPETVAIEASKRNYYEFMNIEQRDASHSTNPGGKYMIHLIAGQIHVLTEWHVKHFKKKAVTPVYERRDTGIEAGPNTVGKLAQECVKVRGEPRWMFEYLGEAPQDAPFGLVTDVKILNELRQTV